MNRYPSWEALIRNLPSPEWGFLHGVPGPVLRVEYVRGAYTYYTTYERVLAGTNEAHPNSGGTWIGLDDIPLDTPVEIGSLEAAEYLGYWSEPRLTATLNGSIMTLWAADAVVYVDGEEKRVPFSDLVFDVEAIVGKNTNTVPHKEKKMSKTNAIAESRKGTVAGVTNGAKRGAAFTAGRTFVKKCRSRGLILPVAEGIDPNVETALYAVVIKTAAEVIGIPKAEVVAGVSTTVLEESVSRIISDGVIGDLFEDLAGLAE